VTRICGQQYTSRSGETLACTAPLGHDEAQLNDPRRFYHSWEWLHRLEEEERVAEEHVEEAVAEVVVTGGPPEIDDLIEGISIGLYDPYIESLLAALHGRKRSMRSVPHPYGRIEE
jgi:hypothetical protein